MNISEVARLAGVSKAAVSRYFNNGYLSEEKREAISRVVTETDYQPSLQAQTLRTRKSRQIGAVIPKLSSESVARMVDGISGVLSESGYQLLLCNTANDPAKEVEYLDLLRHHVEGIIFLGSIFTPDHTRVLETMRIPVVVLGQEFDGCSCVYHDDRGAARAVTEVMLKNGCRHPGYIGVTPQDRAAGMERRRGFFQALGEAGIPPAEAKMAVAEFTMESGYEQAKFLLERDERPDGLFCATDNIAIGAMQFCRETGLRVPEDVMIAGIGDSKAGKVCAVPLTSAHLYYLTSGEEAARLLLSQLRKHAPGGSRSLRLGFEVAERESTRRS